jgi:selenocysteine-specific elongation factor
MTTSLGCSPHWRRADGTVHVVATAGHVDHGKSTLVRALTGTDPDRLDEEKARGLTIDIGFASTTLPSGRGISLIDVPGHVRFIKNMLAGVGSVDACLFVVAATEGWKPQSEEHLRILELLGVRHGVVALTKIGAADDDLRELARLDVIDHVEGTFLEGQPIVEVDGLDGTGLDDLRAALDTLLEATPTATDHRRPRLWVDRSFAAKGAGTVVTGTLGGGTLRVDDELVVSPSGRSGRVRGLQSHHAPRTKVGPGNRVAVNLAGVARTEIVRGNVLTVAGQWHHTRRIDASLHVLASLGHVVSRRGAYVAYIGSGEFPVRVRILGSSSLHPGDQGAVRIFLPEALPLVPGDRFVLRESGRAETVGGGEILDVDPIVPASRAAPSRSVDRVVRERGWVDVATLVLLTGERRPPTIGHWAVDPDAMASTRAEVARRVAAAGPLGYDLAALDDHQRAVVATVEGITVDGTRLRAAEEHDPLTDHRFVAAAAAAPYAPPDPVGVDRGELRELVRHGQLVDIDGIFFASTALEAAATLCARLLADRPEGFTVSDFRVAAGNTRKHALPLLKRMDETGVLRRRGDVRIAGARLPVLTDDAANRPSAIER